MKGEDKPVIRKALVELDGKPFKFFRSTQRTVGLGNMLHTQVRFSTMDQPEASDLTTRTLALEVVNTRKEGL